MKKTLLYFVLMLALCLVSSVSFAQQTYHKVLLNKDNLKATSLLRSRAANEQKSLNNSVGLFYGYDQAEGIDNFYMLFSESSDASFNPNTGEITAKNMWLLFLDLYTEHVENKELPAGSYSLSETPGVPNTYHIENTFAAY